MARRESEIIRRILPILFPSGIDRYLDFACGTGRVTSVVAPHANVSYGIDVSESMLSSAREKCDSTQFLLADITDSIPDVGPVDLITAFRFFGNAQDELRRSALSALARLVKPNGLLLINNHRNPLQLQHLLSTRIRKETGPRPSEGRMDLTKKKFSIMLTKAGFRAVRYYPIGWWVFRASIMRDNILASRMAATLERIGDLAHLSRISPDMVIVARKIAHTS